MQELYHRMSVPATVEHLVESAESVDPERTQIVRRLSLLHGVDERQSLSALTPDEVDKVLGTSSQVGLSGQEASRRLKKHGPNLLQKVVPRSFMSILVDQANVLNLLVLISAGVCLLRGTTIYGVMLGKEPDYFNGGILLGIVLTCMLVGAYMEWSCSRIMADVSSLTTPTCRVLRDGEETGMDVAQIVPGDVVVLSMGEVVPADCLVLEAVDLQVNEVALTGEPYEVHKHRIPEDPHSAFPTNMLYATTSVVNGSGKAVVLKTGMGTEIGKIARHLENQEVGMTQLQITLSNLGNFITIVVVGLVMCVFWVSFHLRVNDPADQCQANDSGCFLQKSLMRALFAACGAIPESLQPVTMLLLVAGMYQMQSVKSAVRKLDAVDSLGSCSFICSDKTGTLTEGKMTCVQLQIRLHTDEPSSTPSKTSTLGNFSFYPTRGFDPRGGIYESAALTREAKAVIEQVVDAMPHVTLPEGVQDFGDPQNIAAESKLVRILMAAMTLSSHGTRLVESVQQDQRIFSFDGNTSEAAMLAGSGKARLSQATLAAYERFKDLEVPFNSRTKMMVSVYKLPTHGRFETLDLKDMAVAVAVLKGAPDVLLPKFDSTVVANSDTEHGISVRRGACDEQDRAWFRQKNADMASQGLRVLCAALRPLQSELLEKLSGCTDASQRLQMVCEADLVMLGLVGMSDPARPSAREAVLRCQAAGIRVAMITGDQRATAEAVARDIGILKAPDLAEKSVSECYALAEIKSKEDIDSLCHQVNVWCRAQPTDKVIIVESLQRQGHVVVMTGDGVNDAAALKKANIGVAMGISGTEVAKGAADVVLLDDRFQTIVDAVEEGRRIFNNVQRMTTYLLCSNIFPVIMVMATMMLGWAVPLEEAQLFKANFVTHMFYPWCMVFEPLPYYGMMQPPRSRGKPIVPSLMAKIVIPAAFLGYFMSMLTAQLAGALLYVGTVNRDEQIGTVSITDFYGESSNFLCLYASVATPVTTSDEQRADDHTTGSLEFRYTRDIAPLHCRIKRLTFRGWVYDEEWGHEDKLEPEVAIQSAEFNWFTGSWGSKFSLAHSFLQPSFGNGIENFADQHWTDRRGWLVKCSDIIASTTNGSRGEQETITGDSDMLCWKPCGGLLCWQHDLQRLQATNTSDPENMEAVEEEDEPAVKPVLYKKYNIAAWGCRQMRSVVLMSMICIELAMLFSFSKHGFAPLHILDNVSFPLAWAPMLGVTMAYMYIPVTYFDQLFAPLDGIGLAASAFIAGVFFTFLESAKAIHRQLFVVELTEKAAAAKLSSEGKLRAFCPRPEAWLQYPERRPRLTIGKSTPLAQGLLSNYGSTSSSSGALPRASQANRDIESNPQQTSELV